MQTVSPAGTGSHSNDRNWIIEKENYIYKMIKIRQFCFCDKYSLYLEYEIPFEVAAAEAASFCQFPILA